MVFEIVTAETITYTDWTVTYLKVFFYTDMIYFDIYLFPAMVHCENSLGAKILSLNFCETTIYGNSVFLENLVAVH